MDKKKLKNLLLACVQAFIMLHALLPGRNLIQEKIKFERITIEQGLSQNTVYCITQDNKGFLWIGTEDGLNRYDGYKFDIHLNRKDDENSLISSGIISMCEDNRKMLWIGTDKGLNIYNPINSRFIRKIKRIPEELKNAGITSIIKDRSGILWIGAYEKGIFEFNPETGAFTPHSSPSSSSPQHINRILEDSSGILWISAEEGLYAFNRKTKTFSKYRINSSSCSSNVTEVYEEPSGVLWIGTDKGGLEKFDHKTQGFIPVIFDEHIPACKGELKINSIFSDSRGNLWIGTYGKGLYVRRPSSNTFINYRWYSGVPCSLSNDYIYSIFEDDSDILWIGTEGGLNKLDRAKNEFVHWANEPGNSNSLSDNYVWSIFEDKSKILWVGTSLGLNKIDKEHGTFKLYKPEKNPIGTNNRVMAIHEDKSGVLRVGTQGGGLKEFDKEKEKFIPLYKKNSKNNYSLDNDHITCIFEDRSDSLWIGTTEGLKVFDGKTGKFTHYKHEDKNKEKSLSHNRITCIFEDSHGLLWVGTDQGLNQFNSPEKVFSRFDKETTEKGSLSSYNISSIHEDRYGNLWVGTYNGLNRFDYKSNMFVQYWKEKNNLPSNTINGILEDNNGYLWISTGKGISKFDPIMGKPNKNYDVGDGLQGDEFNGGSYFKSYATGELFFGGANGLNSFFPGRIECNKHIPPVVITGFMVFNKPYRGESPGETKEFVLDYKQDIFTIEFTVLDYAIPSKNKCSYKMEKIDRDWVEGDSGNWFATYTNLEPGKYKFRVIGINNDGTKSKNESTLSIVIKPPFWRTTWFTIILVSAIVLLLISGYRIRTRFLRNKLAEQERTQKILKQSRDEMERARDMMEIRHAENEKLLTAISSIFIAVDSEGVIFQWNTPSENFFKICRDEAVKTPFIELLKDCIAPDKLNEIMEKGLNRDISSQSIEIPANLQSGGKGFKLLLAGINPIIDQTGKKLGFLFLAEDITHRKEEETLRNLSKKLESLGQMASGIAHEIKTPLQYIGHNARFVGDSFNDVSRFYKLVVDVLPDLCRSDKKEIADKIKKLVEKYDMEFIMEEIPVAAEQIINGVSRVSDIVTAMNEFSHPGRGVKEKVDINGLLKSTVTMIQNRVKKNADIRMEFSENVPPVPCFPGEMNQVFLNILSNAVDAIIESGKWGFIEISTSVENNEVVISISDSGCGISEENIENIFNPFFTTKEVGKGTGQGLSMAHNIVTERHKGKIDFTSKVGEGTTFYIRLPIEGEH